MPHRVDSRETERLFRAYFEASTEALFVYDSDGRLLNANEAAKEMHGLDQVDLLEVNARELFAPDAQSDFESFDSARVEGGCFRTTTCGQRRDGTTFEMQVAADPVEIGGAFYYFSKHVDVTETHRRAAEKERQTEYRELVSELCSHLLKTTTGSVADGIEFALERIGRTFDIDYCDLWWNETDGMWRVVHRWTCDAMVERSINQTQALTETEVKWFFAAANQRDTLRFESLEQHPREAASIAAYLERAEIHSHIVIPLWVDEKFVGGFTAGTWRRTRRWPDTTAEELRALGEIVAATEVRRRAMQALASSELRYRNVVEDQTEFILRWTVDGTCTFVNDAYCRAVNVPKASLLGSNFFSRIASSDLEGIKAQLDELTPESPVYTGEMRTEHPSDSIRIHQWTMRGVFDARRKLIEVQSVGRDITERRLDEKKLRRHAEFESLVAELSASLLDADPSALGQPIRDALERIARRYEVDVCTLWSSDESGENWVRVYEWDPGGAFSSLPHVQSREAVSYTADAMRRGETVCFETHDDYPPEAAAVLEGHRQLGLQSVVLIPNQAAGVIVGVLQLSTTEGPGHYTNGVVEELRIISRILTSASMHALAHKRLVERKAELTRSQELARAGSYVVFPKSNAASVSPEYRKILGFAPDYTPDLKSLLAAIHPEDREHIQASLATALEREDAYEFEYRLTRADQTEIVIQDRGEVERDEQGLADRIFGSVLDITERRGYEDTLRARAAFEAFVARTSSKLLAADSESEASQIREVLESIALRYQVDFCAYWSSDQEGRKVHSYSWENDDRPAQWVTEFDLDDIPWIRDVVSRGEVVRIEEPEDFPPEASSLQKLNQQLGIHSDLIVPVDTGDGTGAALEVGMWRDTMRFEDAAIDELRILGGIVGVAIARAQARRVLIERDAELVRSQNMAGVGSYVFFPKQGHYTSTPELDAIHGIGEDDERTVDSWASLIHPDDRDRVLEVLQRVIEEDSSHAHEYRIIRPDGAMRAVRDYREVERDEHGEAERVFGTVLDITNHRKIEDELSAALEQLESLRQKLEDENLYLREEVRLAHADDRIIGNSPALQRCLRLAERVAPTDASVLIIGETGTGKELIAQLIHRLSGREGSLVSVNCAVLPANLIESELFGHEKGAFTGAHSRKPGRLELAERGSLFLDEIGELPINLQAKLLRALQEGEFERVGGVKKLEFKGRVIAATNRDLEESVRRGEFRSDLFFRLNVFPVEVPALRERREDIPELARYFAVKYGKRLGREVTSISSRMIDAMTERDWPGNIRELENFIHREMIVGDGSVLDLAVPQHSSPRIDIEPTAAPGKWRRLDDVERDYLAQVLEQSGWKIEGSDGAARRLGLAPSTLRSRMKKFGLSRTNRDQSPRV